MSKSQNWIIILIILASIIFFMFAMAIFISSIGSKDGYDITSSGSKIALVEVIGTIYSAENTIRQLEKYKKDDSVKGIVLRIESPGGGIAASQEMYEKIKQVRDSGKPIIASMGAVAASGGYYIACGADTIMANPGTTTGSIGVIAEIPNTKDLLDKIGVRFEILKSGKYKDTGSPFRKMTAEERAYLQGWIDNAYEQFVDVVVKERKLDRSHVLKYADGRIYTGVQALNYGLIDTLGTYEDAINLAGKVAGIEGKPRTTKEHKRKLTFFDLLFQDYSRLPELLQQFPRLKYQLIM